ncbi:MAG: biotin transporter BioY [Oscillospiraceae bacterium]|nr:biotin transporter BioY [Oscillospiraceae bacterium]
MKKNRNNARSLHAAVTIAMTAVVICVCSWLTVPFTVPFTMQTFAVFAALLLLGGKQGLMAIGLYLLLGLVGLPVFSGFRGGPGHLLGPTGGYLLGFLFTGLYVLLIEGVLPRLRWLPRVLLLAAGLVPCYLAGTLWFVAVMGAQGKETGFLSALMLCVVPYILPDIAKLLLAELVARRVKRALKWE